MKLFIHMIFICYQVPNAYRYHDEIYATIGSLLIIQLSEAISPQELSLIKSQNSL
jgi:hypothetical protein